MRKRVGLGTDDGEVGPGIGSHDATAQLPTIGEANIDALGLTDDVMVGQEETIGCEQDAGAGCFADARDRHAG